MDIGETAPMTPPELWGIWRDGVLVWPLPVTPPSLEMSPGTPEGLPPMTPPDAFVPATPPGPPPLGALPLTPPEAWWPERARDRLVIVGVSPTN